MSRAGRAREVDHAPGSRCERRQMGALGTQGRGHTRKPLLRYSLTAIAIVLYILYDGMFKNNEGPQFYTFPAKSEDYAQVTLIMRLKRSILMCHIPDKQRWTVDLAAVYSVTFAFYAEHNHSLAKM